MTAVARVLPRHWDGGRLLRFLTGLAMLALAFTARLDAPPAPLDVPPAPVAPAVVGAPAPAAAPVAASVAPAEPAPAASRFPLPGPVPAAAITFGVVLLAGVTLRIRGQRAPPPA